MIFQNFENKLKIRDFVILWVVGHLIQDPDIVTCGIFQTCFFDNFFNPDKNSEKQNETKLNKKKTIKILLADLFLLDDQQQKEKIINKYAKENDITVT